MVGFIEKNDYSYAGKHLLVDLYGCQDIQSIENIKQKLENICRNLGATVLFSHAHKFENGGSSGVIILAESHCTWHHWLDEEYIALDIFVCGKCNPRNAIDELVDFFKPKRIKSDLHKRGVIKLGNLIEFL